MEKIINENINDENINPKKAEVVILILDKVNFRIKIIRERIDISGIDIHNNKKVSSLKTNNIPAPVWT